MKRTKKRPLSMFYKYPHILKSVRYFNRDRINAQIQIEMNRALGRLGIKIKTKGQLEGR